MGRQPAVAGMFYEADPEALKKRVNSYLIKSEKQKAIGVMSPHAGYIYSGKTAGEVFSAIEIPGTIIILGPNHTGMGEPVAVMNKGEWRMPLGNVSINTEIADEIIKNCEFAKKDSEAHIREHSIEVQLPFLQVLRKEFSFVPIALADPDREELKTLASAIAGAVKGKEVLIVASSDLTHYESAESAKKKDSLVLKAIEALDPDRMADEVEKKGITMCGWMAVYVMIHAVKMLGAKEGKIIKYTNSGEASGDFSSVVGYGGAVII